MNHHLHASLLFAVVASTHGCASERVVGPASSDPRHERGVEETKRTDPSDASAKCGDAEGAWSRFDGGLRGRLVTSGSRADRSALRVAVELENVAGQGALEINWSGYTHGFATFQLADATGAEVPEPPWRLGGNAPGGNMRVVIAPAATVRHVVADNLFSEFDDKRIIVIGVFWAREMPPDGSPRFLRARVTGHAPVGNEALVGDDGVARAPSPSDPRGHPWIGTLELPAVCVR